MGKNANLKKIRKKLSILRAETDPAYYLDLDRGRATVFRERLAKRFATALTNLQLSVLPPDFTKSFFYLLGHLLVGVRASEFWDDIRESLHFITHGEDNQLSLAAWNHGDFKQIESDPRIHCFNCLQQVPDIPDPTKMYVWLVQAERIGLEALMDDLSYCEAIPNYITISAAFAGDNAVLHKAGTLYLLHQKKELWLARFRPDGIYATSRLSKIGTLKPSEFKSMKSYISSYDGERIEGRLESGGDAERICKALGMTVDNGFASIGH
jgi:hypothetical protein